MHKGARALLEPVPVSQSAPAGYIPIPGALTRSRCDQH
jgi:hypothetical protein